MRKKSCGGSSRAAMQEGDADASGGEEGRAIGLAGEIRQFRLRPEFCCITRREKVIF